ncbi:MAG: hypothetical protein K0S33_4053 [Bacteroidetes bacterium]|jgi:hypothetical protein|nr:hypothetical protein [Bacteroidota bacterium]
MFNLKQSLDAISAKWKYKLEELSTPGIYRMDVAIKIGDDKWRYQFVYIWESKERYYGQPAIYLNSRCGEISAKLNLYNILKESAYGNLSSLTITTDKRADGSDCETIICQAALPVEFITEDMLSKTIFEVANNADIVEEKYFGGDGN